VTITANGTPIWTHVLVVDTRGDNFASEVIATLAAILGVPLDADLLIVTDALSALQSIHYGRTWDWGLCAHLSSFGIPDRKRILAAMRPYITYIRMAITQRTGRTTLEHVRSHSGATTTHALGNDRADKIANEARRAVDPDEWCGPNVQDIAACEPITVSTEAEDYGIVLGALRPRLLTERIKATLDFLASRTKRSPRASDLANTHGRRILSWTNAARYSRCGELMKLVVLALTQALPSEHVLWQARKHTNNDNRGPSCKLCGHPEDNNEHALCRCTNRAVTAARTYACTLATDAFRYADNDVKHHTGPALMDVSALSAGPSQLMRAWFDPSRQLMLEVCPLVSSAAKALETFCPLAGMLGILPKGVRSILSFAKVSGGWRRCSYAEIEDRAQAVRLAIMRGCLHVWQVRHRQFVKWWWSDAPTAIAARTASAASRVKQRVDRASASNDKSTHTTRSKKRAPAPGGPKCSACGKPGHNVRTCRANPASPLSDDDVDMPPVLPPIPSAAVPPLPANLPAGRLCSTCSTPGHDKRNCPDKPVRTPGADGRHSSFTSRSPEAMARTPQPFFIRGAQEAVRWEAEVLALDARWLHDPPAAY
jgi:hypothetical protein